MGRRILNRKELRADFDAAERRKGDDEEVADEEAETEDEEEEEEKAEEEDEGEADAEGEGEGEGEGEAADEDDDKPAPKKKAAKAAKPPKAPKAAKPKRTRAAKVVRMRLVWGVFNNSHQCVATYEYPKRKDAEAHAAKLTADKKNTHFVQPVKEAIEEKKEK
jgi:hypothetical protein